MPKAKKPRIKRLAPTFASRSRTRAVMYTKRAKQFIRRNPEIMAEFLQARKAIASKGAGARITVGKTTVEKIRPDWQYAKYFLIKRGRKKLFIKEEGPEEKASYKSTRQMATMKEAEPILRKHGIQPMQYEFAIQSGNKSFLVAEFRDLETVSELPFSKFLKLSGRIDAAALELSERGIVEFGTGNCLYDPKTRKLIAFDLVKKI